MLRNNSARLRGRSRSRLPAFEKEVTRMPQQPNGRTSIYAARQADLEQRLEKYKRGDLRALDGFDDGFEPEVMQRSHTRSAYTPAVDPAAHHTEHGFIRACVIDLMNNGGYVQTEAFEACKARWDEAEQIGSPVTAGQATAGKALTDGQKRVRAELEKQRPTLDPITQKLWDDWFKRNFDALMSRHIDAINQVVKNLNKEISKSNEAHNMLVENLSKDRDESVDAHNANAKAIKAIREDTKKESADWAKRMDKQFTAEISTLRDAMIFQTSENLNIMLTDVKKVLDIRFTEKAVTVREELRDGFQKEIADLVKIKQDLSSEVTALREKVSCLNDDLNATLADVTNIMRGELVDEFIRESDTMRDTLRKELRQELRHELSAKIKMMRNAFRKHRKV
jgi:predicted  nucleic acid-binding Zn-ribbon protein